jgi:hypothetical protein
MTALREAAQQALEAMLSWQERIEREWGCGYSNEKLNALGMTDPAITALKAALEQYDKDRVWIEERKASWAKDRELVRANAAEESARIAKAAEEGKCWACGALEQPEQEPVAWIHRKHYLLGHAENMPPADKALAQGWEPLYTHPPRREWRGLTDEEAEDIAYEVDANGGYVIEFYRAIEAKLKELNHE